MGIRANTCPYCGNAYTLAAGGCVVACPESRRQAILVREAAEADPGEQGEIEAGDGGPHVGLGTADHIDSRTHNRATGEKY